MIPGIWIFSGDKENVRYCLGEVKKKNILVMGVNPGMSMPGEKQVTTRNVVKVIENHFGADCGWIMVNLHPQRTTNPENLSANAEESIRNIQVIESVVNNFGIQDIWCAWGDAIDNPGKEFLYESLKRIYETIGNKCEWYHYDKLTHKKNPKHPRSAQYDKLCGKLENFSVSDYLTAKGY